MPGSELFLIALLLIFIYSDYGYARPSFDLNAPCMRDAVVTLADPCADGKAETYMASTG